MSSSVSSQTTELAFGWLLQDCSECIISETLTDLLFYNSTNQVHEVVNADNLRYTSYFTAAQFTGIQCTSGELHLVKVCLFFQSESTKQQMNVPKCDIIFIINNCILKHLKVEGSILITMNPNYIVFINSRSDAMTTAWRFIIMLFQLDEQLKWFTKAQKI